MRLARSIPRGPKTEIALKVAFGCLSDTGGKPNGECRLNNLDKSIRRLAAYVTIEPQYEDLRENTNQIVGAGYEVLRELEAGDTAGATRVYASTTVVALDEARADAYTEMSNLERSISKAGLRCK